MPRFKQLWSSFWRKDQGLGMIEAAILLPLFLIITFGVIEFGNMYMTRYQGRDVASSVGDYLQANPSASSGDLQTFVTNLGFGSLKNTGSGEGNNVFTKIKIKSETTMMTAAQFDDLCSGGGDKNWANPWLGNDPADDKNDYYIHICYPYTYNTITPLPNLTAGAIPETKTMNNKAMAYITKEMSCPDGQVMQSFTGGSATCVAKDSAGATCGLGQVVTAVTNGVPTCSAAPRPSFTVRAHTEARYKSRSNDCWSGHVVVGSMPDGDAWCAPLIVE